MFMLLSACIYNIYRGSNFLIHLAYIYAQLMGGDIVPTRENLNAWLMFHVFSLGI